MVYYPFRITILPFESGGGGYRYRVEIHGVGIIKPNYRMLDMCINIIALKRREERERLVLN